MLYNKSGTNLCSGYITAGECRAIGDLEVQGFIAESVTYRIYVTTEEEALYLIGILNSTVVNKAIKPYQTEGVYHGKRDIHRRPFEVCPIPEFDKNNEHHMAISKLAKLAKVTMGKWGPSMEGGLARVREGSRALIVEQIQEIDRHVNIIFGTKTKASDQTLKKVASDQGSIF